MYDYPYRDTDMADVLKLILIGVLILIGTLIAATAIGFICVKHGEAEQREYERMLELKERGCEVWTEEHVGGNRWHYRCKGEE